MNQKQIFIMLFLMNIFTPFTILGQELGMVTDVSTDFIKGNAYGAQIATTPPTIEFGLVQLTQYGDEFGHWGNVVQGPDGKFYFCVGNHQEGEGLGRSLLIAYDSETRSDEILMYSIDVLGHKEGKWHGRPDINPANGDMYILGFFVGDLIQYNIYSRTKTVIGKPVDGSQLPEHVWDWNRERLYSTTQNDDGSARGDLLVYDTRNKQVIFYGRPVDSQTGVQLHWDNRTRCLDREIGYLYGSDTNTKHLIRYNPVDNSFTRLNSKLAGQLRAWTNAKDSEGKYWIFDDVGNVYIFYPNQDLVVSQGKNWSNGCYVAFLEASPGGRYLYYSIAQSSSGVKYGMPIIQYDTRTNQKKAIAFLYNFYLKTYNYKSDKIYGGALNKDGSGFFVTLNGQLGNVRRQSMLYIHIPESERQEAVSHVVELRDTEGHPADLAIDSNFPNPFNASTCLRFRMQRPSFVKLRIVNQQGILVRKLLNEEMTEGTHQCVWNGDDDAGASVASGLYFAVIETVGHRLIQKLMMIK